MVATYRAAPAPALSDEEKILAAVAHAGWVIGFPVVAPLVIYVLRKDQSRFVAFHALQAVIWSVVSFVLFFICMVVAIAVPVAIAATSGDKAGEALGPFLMFATWGGMLVPWGIFMAISIIGAIKAFQGELWSIPIAGRIARRFVG